MNHIVQVTYKRTLKLTSFGNYVLKLKDPLEREQAKSFLNHLFFL